MTYLLPHTASRGTGIPPARPPVFTWKSMSSGLPPKVTVVRQELVALTGNQLTATILNQLLYWTERLPDLDLLIEEEFYQRSIDLPQHGWFYKSAQELIDETFSCITCVTLRKHITSLIESGWIEERANPKNKWNRTAQYRVNLGQLQIDLQTCGWGLVGFPEAINFPQSAKLSFEEGNSENQGKPSTLENEPSKVENLSFDAKPICENPSISATDKNLRSKLRKSTFEDKENRCSKVQNLSFIYLTENTSENTNREHATHVRENQNEFLEEKKVESESTTTFRRFSSCPLQAMGAQWEQHVGQSPQLTEKRKQQLSSVFERHFQRDLSRWEEFCLRLKASPFLMGEGSRRWRVSLDWILIEENLLKILEGNFDDSTAEAFKESKQIKNQKTKEIVDSIIDPQWKEWCTEWAQGIWLNASQVVIEPLSCSNLECIANACFLEVEDERLVWIGSPDPAVLSKLEELRLPLSSIVSRSFPNSRTVRTRLIEPPPTHQPQQPESEKNHAE